jgi:hypothetical protein
MLFYPSEPVIQSTSTKTLHYGCQEREEEKKKRKKKKKKTKKKINK